MSSWRWCQHDGLVPISDLDQREPGSQSPGLHSASVSPGSGVPGLVLGRELFWYKQGLVYLEIISRDCHMCLSTCSRDKSQGGGSVRKYLD